MASSWGSQRQALILLVFFAFVVGAFSGIYLLYFRPTPTCDDGVRNQSELGIDCGGQCAAVCESEVSPLITFWTRIFPLGDGEFDVAAMIENSNSGFSVPVLPYTFKAYDANNVLVFERSGATFANEQERFVIVEPRVSAGNRVPVRAIIEFESPVWKRTEGVRRVLLGIEEKQLTLDPRPRLSAQVVNQSAVSLREVLVSAVVLDADNNAIGVSSTIVDSLPRAGRKPIVFTWSEAFDGTPVVTEIYPRVYAATP